MALGGDWGSGAGAGYADAGEEEGVGAGGGDVRAFSVGVLFSDGEGEVAKSLDGDSCRIGAVAFDRIDSVGFPYWNI